MFKHLFERFMIQTKNNSESSQKVRVYNQKNNKSIEVVEPSYVFESNNYTTITESRASEQPLNFQHHRQSHYKYKENPRIFQNRHYRRHNQ